MSKKRDKERKKEKRPGQYIGNRVFVKHTRMRLSCLKLYATNLLLLLLLFLLCFDYFMHLRGERGNC